MHVRRLGVDVRLAIEGKPRGQRTFCRPARVVLDETHDTGLEAEGMGHLATNPPLFPCLAEEPLCEIEPLLCFRLLLLKALDAAFKGVEPRSDVS